MEKRVPKTESPQFLSGWKEIARYLGKGVRTVQRYECELGLPVRRPAGKDRGSVVAVRAEIDGWVKASPIREAFHLKNPVLQDSPRAQLFLNRLSELKTLRDQMTTLRCELKDSIERLRQSVGTMVAQQRERHLTSLASPQERELLEGEMKDLYSAPVKYPKAS